MIAMVTGAGRGLGKTIALAFEDAGYTVARCIRGAKEFNCDLADASAAPTLINAAAASSEASSAASAAGAPSSSAH